MAIRILSSENITGKLTLTGQQELLELTRGGASDSKWFFSADSLKLYIAEGTSASNNIKMTLTDAGDIGIGILSPTEKLDVVGSGGNTNIRVYDSSANSEVGIKLQGDAKTWTLQNWGSGGDNLRLLNNAGTIVQLWDDNGNVMIGNGNDPEKKLHILTSTTDDTPQVLIQNNSTGDASLTFNVSGQSYVIGIDHDDSSKFKIAASGNLGTNDRVTLLSSGNVGIGTITPQNKFVVANGTDNNQNIEIAPNYIQSFNRQSGNLGYASLDFYASSYTFNVADVLIGTNGKFLQGKRNTGSAVIDMIGFGAGTDRLQIKGGTSGAAESIAFFDTAGQMATFYNSNLGIGVTNPSQKLEVTGNFKLNGTFVQEGTGNNLTFRYRTGNSYSYTGGNATCKFGRFYWTPAHWVTGAPVIKVTLHSKYYQGERREYIIKAGYQDTDPIINELQPSSTSRRITLSVGATTSAGYNYANQPVYYVDLQWVQTSYMWGWAEVESQVAFLTSNPTSGWGGVVMDSSITQNNLAGLVEDHNTFFAGNLGIGTSNPDNPLFIFTDTKDSTVFKIRNYLATANGTVYQNFSELKFLSDTNGNAPAGIRHYANLWHNADSALAFFTNQHGGSYTERMRIDGDGNVGINVTDPSAVLDIYSPYDVTANPNSTGIRLRRVAGGSQSFLLGMGVSGVSNDYFAIRDITNSAYRFVIDDSGNVGIGTSSPDKRLTVGGADPTEGINLKTKSGSNVWTIWSVEQYFSQEGYMRLFYDNVSTIQFRADGDSFFNGGDVGIGTTSPSVPLQVHGQQKWYTTNADGNELRGFFNPGGSGDDAELSVYKADGATEGVVWRGTGNSYIRIDSTSLKFINFYYGPSNVGQIVTGGSNVLYQSNSDYRLKENVVEMTGALDRVSELKPSTYNFISHPEEQVDGFMAHELQEVVPQAVSGKKDEMNEDGTPKYQGVDHSQIVPLLVGAIKELKAEIENLKSQKQ